MNFFQAIYLAHFSMPVEERSVFRAVIKRKPKSIAEIGIQQGNRTEKLLQLALRNCESPDELLYLCSDPFEGRTQIDGCGLSLRKAYRLLSGLGVRFRAVPSEPISGVAQLANADCAVDLLVVASPDNLWLPYVRQSFNKLLLDDAVVLLGTRNKDTQVHSFAALSKSEFLARHCDVSHTDSESVAA